MSGAPIRVSRLVAPAFRELWRDVRARAHAEYWLMGGRGSGKSSFVSLAILCGLLRDPDAHAIIYRKVGATLKESVCGQMAWAAGALGLTELFEFRSSPPEMRFRPTGQRILFRGADDPGKSKSIKPASGYFGFLWFEELAEFSGVEDLRSIKASVLRGGGGPVTFCSYNPPVSAANWVNREALAERPGRLAHRSDYRDMPPEWLGEAFLSEAEHLRRCDERAWRHMYLGEVTGTGLNVFSNLSVRPISPQERAAFGSTYAGLDWGWYPDPLHFARCAYAPSARRLWVFDEWRANRVGIREAAAYLTQRKGVRPSEEIIADSAEMKSVSDLRALGLNCVGAVKGPGSVRASMKWLQSLNEIVVDPAACPYAAREFAEYEYEKDREGHPVDVYPDRDNHAIDAVRYAMNRVWIRAGA